MLQLATANDTLQFDADTGQLVSLRSRYAPQQEFILTRSDDPVFVIQYLDADKEFRQISSQQAEQVLHRYHDSTIVFTFQRLGGLDLYAMVTIRAGKTEPFSHWSLSLTNHSDLRITDVQFPFVVLPYQLDGAVKSERLLIPIAAGRLMPAPQPHQLEPDSPHAWQMRPENSTVMHYPGFTTAQFLAYFNDRAGVYVACYDSQGFVKQIKPVHHDPGLRLGISHVGDFPVHGTRTIEYDVVLTSFTGDWYAAADIYREWSRAQHWGQKPLHKREDVPAWLLDSPPHIILRIQGELDLGPAQPNAAFLPYSKTIPLLQAVSERIEAPVLPVIMSWERGGPWVYPDCFPPAGGGESLREFTDAIRERDWHVGTFCNGTRWVVGHFWSGYDGRDYFETHHGEASISRTHTGALWQENWDATWRPSYAGCLGAPLTLDTADHFLKTVIDDYGLDWVQFLDQNVGCATFPCFATDHEHPPVPGHWMTDKMQLLVDTFHARAASAQGNDPARKIVFSVEGPPNEYFMPHFQICDIRVVPPGMRAEHWLWWDWVPLYHFLYHEYILIQGGFGHGADPHHLAIRNAYNLVVGEILGAVMEGNGDLLNVDSAGINWAPWGLHVGSNDEALEMLRTTTALRRGPARDFLVMGRMLAPAKVKNIKNMEWNYESRVHNVPAVFHGAWQAPDGRLGIVLSNWTTDVQRVTVTDPRLGDAVIQHIASQSVETKSRRLRVNTLAILLPPHSCVLIEPKGNL